MVRLIIFSVPILDVLWFLWAWWRTSKFPHRAWWRAGITLFFVLMLSHFVWMMLYRRADFTPGPPPLTLGMAYIWHLLVIPGLSAIIAFAEAIFAGRLGVRYFLRKPVTDSDAGLDNPAPDSDNSAAPTAQPSNPQMSRRGFLAMAAVAAPPVLTLAAGLGGYGQSRGFRIRPLDVPIAGLPAELDGATIAVLSDVHAGKFTDEKVMARIAEACNELRADLILAPGDIIDFSLSDLPSAIDMMSKLDAPGGVYLCEGNHDLFESREGFEEKVKASGLGLLINETETLRLRGRDVQVHGLRWGAEGRRTRGRGHHDDAGAKENFALIKGNIDPDAFSIAVAHHPHAFEAAAANGVHLTVSGHTHGGQLMLTDHIGAGPMMFRYWSGLYQENNSSLVVSNGVGNWLPLRINAPAEIVHLTLRRALA